MHKLKVIKTLATLATRYSIVQLADNEVVVFFLPTHRACETQQTSLRDTRYLVCAKNCVVFGILLRS